MKTTASRLYQVTGALFISLFGSAFMANEFRFNFLASFLAIAMFFFIPKPAAVAGSGAMDMSELATELSTYANENKTGLFTQIVNSAMYDFMTPIADVTDQVPLVQLLVGDILQPGGKSTFNPQDGKIKFKQRYGKVRPGKADLQLTQEQIQQLKKSWIGLMDASKGALDVYSFPFEAFIFSKITERFRKNIKQAMIKGVYNASGTGKLDVMDGLLTIADDDISAGNIPAGNVFAGAPITENNGVAQVEGVVFKTLDNEDYADAEMVALMSPKTQLNYERNFRSLYTSLPYNLGFDKPTVYGTNVKIQSIPEWTGSDRILVTPKENLVMLYDDISKANNILAEKEKRNINILMDVEVGVNYAIGETVWTNDQN